SASQPDQGLRIVGNYVTEILDARPLEPVDISELVLPGQNSDPAGSARRRPALDRDRSFAAEQPGVARSEVAGIVCRGSRQFLPGDDLEPGILIILIEYYRVSLLSSFQEAEQALAVASRAVPQNLFRRQRQPLPADTNLARGCNK